MRISSGIEYKRAPKLAKFRVAIDIAPRHYRNPHFKKTKKNKVNNDKAQNTKNDNQPITLLNMVHPLSVIGIHHYFRGLGQTHFAERDRLQPSAKLGTNQ